ncbi:hypothetical protein [Janthinobacterium tructae]|jgi:hypothetical protein|uniref:Transmembrane protein n=1 Tax=Janthinobacterium tructae TaxID=2590869 RepID=A0A4Y6RBD5_9BURK|nr:hypothetical protein [Janthinobacterium tructae]QDG70183.1 hypothetical protein FJQ89_06950 [Janthinobacterium tructae]
METLSIVVLALIFLSLPVTIACGILVARLKIIRAGGHGAAGCVLRYIAQGLGLPIVVVALVSAFLMLLSIGGGPAWIWPIFFYGLVTYFAIGWALAWIAVGCWFLAKHSLAMMNRHS